MTILVTGASGFIGKHLMSLLDNENNKIICTYRHINSIPDEVWSKKVFWVEHDISSPILPQDNLFQKFGSPNKMIHLAWNGLPHYGEEFHITKNLPADILFLEHMISKGLNDITITGTCFEYGMIEGELKESMITNPNNPYAIAKDSLRKYLEFIQSKYSFTLKWLRLFYMYGKNQSPNSLFSQLENAILNQKKEFNMSKGEQIRDYLPVETVAKNIIRVALQNKKTGIINNCSGNPISVKQFIENYLSSINKKIKLNLGFYPYSQIEPMHFWGDSKIIKKITSNE